MTNPSQTFGRAGGVVIGGSGVVGGSAATVPRPVEATPGVVRPLTQTSLEGTRCSLTYVTCMTQSNNYSNHRNYNLLAKSQKFNISRLYRW